MQLSVPDPAPASSPGRESATLRLNPSFQALSAIVACDPVDDAQTELSDVFAEIQAIADVVTSGDLKHPEAITVAHATVLNVMFARLSSLAFHNMANPEFNSLMRLALRAQAQSVRTLESLARLRKPSILARQLNVASQQIVNNSPSPAHTPPSPKNASPPAPVLALNLPPPPSVLTADPNLVRFTKSDKTIPPFTPQPIQT
jgi:hypothetical protein